MFATTIFIILLAAHGYEAQRHFKFPPPLVQPLLPVGLRITIPDTLGITYVKFYVKFIKVYPGVKARGDVNFINGRWVWQDRAARLHKGDIFYYTVRIVHRGISYDLANEEYVVTDFYDYAGNRIRPNGGGGDGGNDGGNNNPDAHQGVQCQLSVTKQTDYFGHVSNPCAGQVLFYDDFQSSRTLQQKGWTYVERFPDFPDYEFNVWRYKHANIIVDNGLRLSPSLLSKENLNGDDFVLNGELTLQQCTGRVGTSECTQQARGFHILPPVFSSRINTKNALKFEYGRVEIRAKLPRGDWIYPLIMLEPLNANNDQSLASLRIRIASANGNPELSTFGGQDISGRVLWGGVAGLKSDEIDIRDYKNLPTQYNNRLWSDDFHNYEVVWSPDSIVWKVDGKSYYEHQVSLPPVPFYLTLAVAVGGYSEFPDYSISQGYAKPWRNVEAKALYKFFNATDSWFNTWQAGATSLNVQYVRITAL